MAILIDSSASPLLSGTPGATHTLSSTLTGVVTYLWAIVSQPPGTADTLSSTSAATPMLIARKEGSYLIRLTATSAAGTTQETALLVNPSITSGLRVPAYEEVIEAGATGWDQGAGNMLRSLDLYREQAGVIACVADGTITPGTPVTVAVDPSDPMFSVGAFVKLSGLPGERSLPKAFSGITPYVPLVGIAIGTTSGGTANAGDVVLVRVSGLYQGLSVTYGALSSDYPFLFPDGSGGLTATLPTSENNSRCVGKIVRWDSGTAGVGSVVDVMIYGDRVPRIKTIEFGSNATTDLSNSSESWLPMGTNTPSIGTYHGQFVADLGANAATILATAKVWAAIPYAVVTTLKVKNARTLATFGSSFTLGSSAQESSTGFWMPFDITDPVGLTGQIASGATSPKAIAATLTFWEL